jgi:hypothetical protein
MTLDRLIESGIVDLDLRDRPLATGVDQGCEAANWAMPETKVNIPERAP